MRGVLALVLGASVLFMLPSAHAGPREYLFHNERVCDAQQVLCFRGTFSYESNSRLLHLRARVRSAPGPGLLRIRLAGANQQGHRRLAFFEVQVRGQYSEIINHKMIPDHPDVSVWAIEVVEFTADTYSSGTRPGLSVNTGP